jgi:hypothetical protein
VPALILKRARTSRPDGQVGRGLRRPGRRQGRRAHSRIGLVLRSAGPAVDLVDHFHLAGHAGRDERHRRDARGGDGEVSRGVGEGANRWQASETRAAQVRKVTLRIAEAGGRHSRWPSVDVGAAGRSANHQAARSAPPPAHFGGIIWGARGLPNKFLKFHQPNLAWSGERTLRTVWCQFTLGTSP